MPAAKIFLTGATGYIGGSFLITMLKYPHKYEVTTLVRNPDHVEPLKKLGVQVVLGGLDDLDLLTHHATASDAVVHTANADHLPSAQAIVQGLKAKKDKRAVLVHTSGTGVLTYSRDTIEVPFDDEDMPRIHAIPQHSPHKHVDSWVFNNCDDITAAIIAPSTINGLGTGLFRPISHQVPALTRAAAARKQAGWVGPRKNVLWGDVNIHDVVELYRLVLDGLLANEIPHGRDGGWYFASTEEHEWTKVAEIIAKTLLDLGVVKTLELAEFETEYVNKYLWGDAGTDLWAGDSRCVANRSKKIGWSPTHPSVYDTVEQEVRYMYAIGEIGKATC